MATAQIGNVSEFSESREDFEAYMERLTAWFEANDIADDKKSSVFLAVVGPEAYKILRNLTAPDKPSTKTFQELSDALNNHYRPKPIIIAERFRFYKRPQKQGESVADFAVELRRLATTCKFPAEFLQEALRDAFVCGLLNTNIQRKMLSETDLTFARAQQLATAMSMAGDFNTQTVSGNINKVSSRESKQSRYSKQSFGGKNGDKPCWRCLKVGHAAENCRFKEKTCFSCKEVGHIIKACPKGKQKKNGGKFSQK